MSIWYTMIALAIIIGSSVFAARRRRRRGSLVLIRFDVQVALGTLADNVAVEIVTVDSLEQDFDIVSTDLVCAIRNHTANEGPLDFGLAQQGYTVTEIVECLDASPLSQYGPEMERSRRKVRLYGRFAGNETEETVNDGEPIRKRMFLKAFGHSTFAAASVWIVNRSGATLTTGCILEATGTHWGRWK